MFKTKKWGHEVEPHAEVPPIASTGCSTGKTDSSTYAGKQDYILVQPSKSD